MIAEYLRSFDAVTILGVVALLFSIILFCGMLVLVFRLKDDNLATMARLPLDQDTSSNSGV